MVISKERPVSCMTVTRETPFKYCDVIWTLRHFKPFPTSKKSRKRRLYFSTNEHFTNKLQFERHVFLLGSAMSFGIKLRFSGSKQENGFLLVPCLACCSTMEIQAIFYMSVLGVDSIEADPLPQIQKNQNESLQRRSEALTCPRTHCFPTKLTV
jgi:hypothetical protein